MSLLPTFKSLRIRQFSKQTLPPLTKFLMRVYNAGIWYLASPFYFKINFNTSCPIIVVKSGFVLQVILIVLQSATLFSLVDVLVRQPLWWDRNFTNYYSFFTITCWFLCISITIWTNWQNGDDRHKILDTITRIESTMKSLTVKMPSQATANVASYFLIMFVFVWVLQKEPFWDLINQEKSLYKVLVHNVCKYRSGNCFGYKIHPNSSFHDVDWDRPTQAYAAFLLVANSVLSEIMTLFAIVTVLCHAIVFYVIIHQFIQHLERNEIPEVKLPLVLEIFEEICILSQMMDRAIGPMVASTCFGMLPYYCQQTKRVFQNGSNLYVVQFFIFIASISSILILGAEANSILGNLRHWLQANRSGASVVVNERWRSNWHDRVMFALDQLQWNQIGIRGRAFTITYGFVGNMVTLILSYSVLVSQMSADA